MEIYRTPTLAQRIGARFVDLAVVPFLPAKVTNLLQCRRQNLWNQYFRDAEFSMETRWQTIIWPLIQNFDFTTVLELAPGAGRNTEKLCAYAKQIMAVDYNAYALEQARARLGSSHGGCAITYHRNGGSDLNMVPDASVTAIYCWDSAVHFDRDVLIAYTAEFARVLRPGGFGFLHHSDLGDRAHKNITRNPEWRSNVSKEIVAGACRKNGLTVTVQQPVPWGAIVDCATVFCRDAESSDRRIGTAV